VEDVLLAEDRLTAARYADDQIDRVAKEASVEDLVQTLVAARKSFDQ